MDVIINGGNAGALLPYPTGHLSERPDFPPPPSYSYEQFMWVQPDSDAVKVLVKGPAPFDPKKEAIRPEPTSRGDSYGKRGSADVRGDRNSRGE